MGHPCLLPFCIFAVADLSSILISAVCKICILIVYPYNPLLLAVKSGITFASSLYQKPFLGPQRQSACPYPILVY